MDFLPFYMEKIRFALIFGKECSMMEVRRANVRERVKKMNESICNFLPPKNYAGDIRTVHFVYETEFHKFSQPFVHPLYYAHLVTGGNATLTVCEKSYSLTVGDLFFSFSGCPYTIAGSEDFRYLYISFMGKGVPTLLENLKIGYDTPVYTGIDRLLDFWFSAIARVNKINASLLAESVLLYTLSYINNEGEKPVRAHSDNLFSMLVDYVETHFTDPNLSLAGVAQTFSYTEKYISYLFKKNMKIGFNQYVGSLRFQRGVALLEKGEEPVSDIALSCGYRDALYFSKIIKKCTGLSPSAYRKEKKEHK